MIVVASMNWERVKRENAETKYQAEDRAASHANPGRRISDDQRAAWAFLLATDVRGSDFLQGIKSNGKGRAMPVSVNQAPYVLREAATCYGWTPSSLDNAEIEWTVKNLGRAYPTSSKRKGRHSRSGRHQATTFRQQRAPTP